MGDRNDYERGFIDGMSHQAKSSVDKAVNAMSKREWVGLTEEDFFELAPVWFERETSLIDFVAMVEAKLKEKNT